MSECDHASFDAESSELCDVWVAGDDVSDVVVDGEEFVEADAAGVADVSAFGASDAFGDVCG